jgi:hypothetical protein
MEELLMEELLMHKSPLISYSLNNSCAFNVNDYFNEIVHIDYDYWLRALEHCNCVYVEDTCVYYDCGHGDGQNY